MRVVRSIIIFLFTLILIPRDGLSEHSDHANDHHEEEDEGGEHHVEQQDPFSSVNKFLLENELKELQNGQEHEDISYDKTRAVVDILLHRFDCSERFDVEEGCEKCADSVTEHVFRTLDVSLQDGLTEKNFSKASVILFYLFSLENIGDTCTNSTKWQTSLEAYTEVILNTDGSTDALTEEELEAIFDEFGHSYHSETNAKCFNVETIFEAEVDDHEAGATGEELLHISPLMISYLLQGYCIGEASETDPQEFLENIFVKYGHDGTIPEEDFEAMLTSLSIGGAVEDSHGDEEDGHNHAKRSLRSHRNIDSITKREVVDDHGHGSSNGSKVMDVSSTCFTGEDLLTIHGVDHEIGITEEQFVHLCPSLMQQILSESCNQVHDDGPKEISPLVWLYGSVAVFIISLGALLGGLLLPCLPARFFEKFIHSLIALAIAILAGDALIHLLPLAIGIHGHEEGSHVVHSPLDEELAFAWKSLACLSAIYAFYLLETIMGWWSDHEHAHPGDMHMTNADGIESKKSRSQKELTKHTDSDSADFSSESGGCLSKYGALPVMVIIGDGLHNFGDGLAIGAAFTASVGAGISTSVAVLCHEVPHELGDLAILLKSGLKLKTALCLNFMSALTSFAGLYLGIALATTEVARQWIFAVTAGMFLYVALADMMPQITHIKNVKDPFATFILQNIFFLAGAVFIFVIAIYEDAINFNY